MNVTAGRELDALVAEKVMGDFANPESVGYYGPPASGIWRHEDSVRFETAEEATAAYRRIYGLRSAEENHGKADPDEVSFDLCYWQDGWGPRLIEDYSTDIAAAWLVVEHFADAPVGIELIARPKGWSCLISVREQGDYEEWADTAPLAICGAALMAVGAYTEPVGNLP